MKYCYSHMRVKLCTHINKIFTQENNKIKKYYKIRIILLSFVSKISNLSNNLIIYLNILSLRWPLQFIFVITVCYLIIFLFLYHCLFIIVKINLYFISLVGLYLLIINEFIILRL